MSKGFLMKAERNVPGGVPTLNKDGLLNKSQIPLPTPELIGAEVLGAADNALALHNAKVNAHPQYSLLTDSRLTDTRTPKPHNHNQSEIIYTVPIWTNLTLLNSWTNKAGQVCQYRKYPNGIVEVKFWLLKASNPTLSEALFNLPTGHRPIADYQCNAVMTDNKKAYILGHLNIGVDGFVGFFSNKMDANTEVRGRLVFGVE